MVVGLKSKTLHALFWSFFERIGQQGVQFIISIILARLLLPEQFGLIGMLTIFMAVAQSFLDSGFGAALIQKQDATNTDTCSIFYFNIVIGLCAVGLMFLAAPLIADFYNEPLLTPLTRFLSLSIIINSFGLIQTTLLIKLVDFKTQAKISILSLILSGLIGLGLAFNGFGVWSLAIQHVCSNLFRTTLVWLFSTWRPSLLFSFSSLREMFAFSSRMLAADLLNVLFENCYFIVIGKFYSAASLGFYSRALSLQKLPTLTLTNIVLQVAFPLFSTIQDDVVRLKSGFKKIFTTMALINFPLLIGLSVVAKPLVLVLMTEKWLPCVPFLQLLCAVGLLYPLHAINLVLLKAKGRSDFYFRLEMLKKILIVINIAITWHWGIQAMICGQLVISVGAYYLNSYYTARLIGYSFKEQVVDLLPALGVAMLMGICIYSMQLLPFANALSLLISQILTGGVVYIALGCIFRVSVFVETFDEAINWMKMNKVWPGF